MAVCFFFQAEDGIRDVAVTGVQTCALPISKIPLLQVDEIEVDEGGISALYGSSAMAGAIDLTTRRPSSALVDVEGLWGTKGTGQMDLFVGDRRGRVTYSLRHQLFRTRRIISPSALLRVPR